MSSYGQVRWDGESWPQALRRNIVLLRTEGVLAQGMRYALTGLIVSAVYISITTLLALVSHFPFELALAIGWCTAVCVHFTLQRLFVWTHLEGFALPFGHQVGRYMLVAVSQLIVTATASALLPALLGVPAEAAYLATAMLLTLVNFLVFRNRVFHPGGAEPALG